MEIMRGILTAFDCIRMPRDILLNSRRSIPMIILKFLLNLRSMHSHYWHSVFALGYPRHPSSILSYFESLNLYSVIYFISLLFCMLKFYFLRLESLKNWPNQSRLSVRNSGTSIRCLCTQSHIWDLQSLKYIYKIFGEK